MKPNFAYFMKMGTGKSKVAIEEAAELWLRGKIDVVIILCLNGLQQNWHYREIPQHCPVPFRSAHKHGGWLAKERHHWNDLVKKKDDSKLTFFAMNFEAVRTKDGLNAFNKLLTENKVYLFMDESQALKTPTSSVTKAMLSVSHKAQFKRLASGTAAPNSPLDLWSQFMILDPGILRHRIFTTFKAEYANQKRMFTASGIQKRQMGKKLIKGRDYFDKILGYRGIEKLSKLIDPYTYACQLSDMPPITYSEYWCTMDANQKRIYKDLKQELIAATEVPPEGLADPIRWLVNNADVVPQNSLTKILRLQQVTSGFVKDDDGVIKFISDDRIKELAALIETMGDQSIIIWCLFREDIARIKTLLGDQAVEYHGGVNADDRTRAIDKFQAGEVQFFIGQPASGGVGITLTKSTQTIWYSYGFNAMHYAQANARNHRIGQDQPVHVTHMVAHASDNFKILAVCDEKLRLQEQLIYGN